MNVRRYLPVFLLVAAALVLRFLTQSGNLAGWWVNVSPVMALCFVGGALLPGRYRWAVLGGLVVVDLLVQGRAFFQYLGILAVAYLVFSLAIAWGGALRGRATGLGLLGRLLGVSLGFYLVTNTASWALSPGYAKTAAGWLQALTVGLPGFPPTWVFLRNALVSDLGFGALLLAAHNLGCRGQSAAAVPMLRSGPTTRDGKQTSWTPGAAA